MTTNSADRCGSCGEEVTPGAAFCRACGARREQKVCGSCHAPVVPGAAFCRACGAPVAGAEAADPSDAQTLVQPVQPPSPPPPPESQRRGSWRTPILIALAIVLLGAGAAAAIVIGTDESGEPAAAVAETEAPDTSGEETDESEETAEEDIAAEEPEPYPPVSRAEMEEEIESLLLTYHEDLVFRDFRSAWALLSSRKRQQNLAEYGYREWKEAQASLSEDLSPYGVDVRIDSLEGEGVARVMVTGMGWSAPGSPCSEWSGLTWAKYERGEWTYDPGYSTTEARRRSWEPRSGALLGANC